MLDVIRDVGMYLSTVPGPMWAVASIVLMGVYRKLSSTRTPKLVDYRKSLGQQILASLKTAPDQWVRTKAGELVGMNGRVRVAMHPDANGSVTCLSDKIKCFIDPKSVRGNTSPTGGSLVQNTPASTGETDLATIIPDGILYKIKTAATSVHNKFAEQAAQREAANLAASLQPLSTSLPVLHDDDIRKGPGGY